MAESLEARLRDHEKAFDGLLSLIPAKLYYGEDTSDQWQRKKQTKEEARAAKRAKLDPANSKSAKDIMDENARKRKREENEEDVSDIEGVSHEQPKEGLRPVEKKSKKEVKDNLTAENNAAAAQKTAAEKRKEKRERRKAKAALKAEKERAKEQRKKAKGSIPEELMEQSSMAEAEECTGSHDEGHVELDPTDAAQLKSEEMEDPQPSSTSSPSSQDQSPAFDPPNVQSGTSSISSIADRPSVTSLSKARPEALKPKADPEVLRARLQERIEALRAARKADNEDGTPARTRQELIESRRRKDEQRKAHKKELRQQAKEEERRQREEVLAHGSPLLSPSVRSPHGSHGQSPLSEPSNSFAFGRISFDNGQSMTANLDSVFDPHKKKGSQDAHTALEAAQKRDARIAALDPNKRADVEEKDMWLSARKRAHGERVRDDSSLLKKALKRKEKQKKKSEKDWTERLEGVAKGQAMRQQKREDNLRKRKEEKGNKGKKSHKGTKPKSKARPGFEGSFRTGGKRK